MRTREPQHGDHDDGLLPERGAPLSSGYVDHGRRAWSGHPFRTGGKAQTATEESCHEKES